MLPHINMSDVIRAHDCQVYEWAESVDGLMGRWMDVCMIYVGRQVLST